MVRFIPYIRINSDPFHSILAEPLEQNNTEPGKFTEKSDPERLYFIDALRAWAILMMLQGHFVSALLMESYREDGGATYFVWAYLRGVTAPVFFTVSGFIFTYLLFKHYEKGWANPRIKKGFKRGGLLILIGYVLQIKFGLLLKGSINTSFDIVHVLQCLGLSMILIIVLYLTTHKFSKYVFQIFLGSITILLFLSNGTLGQWEYSFLPDWFSNYITRENGSVFTMVPWFGFATAGGCISGFFQSNLTKKGFYPKAFLIILSIGILLIFQSYESIRDLVSLTEIRFFHSALDDSYLFARLGVVLVVFALFIFLRNILNHKIINDIGQNTLAIYILHAIVLYGSITGYGLSRYYHHSLSLSHVVLGAVLFLIVICSVVLMADRKVKRLFS
ncbi:heparan-alpha-glucosaminide N-acetyltransferase domain-containing protein [Muricauda sp. 334s03]|uniref:Heparan-alpha-glucosaminide N-acetyltransferase domain-containing protein n=1 Tax=Flagellimonas yonaguniensis TaxID=3031325 RepID=A0ABT5Y1V9_9FLAO|nr:acyltransferase family protein [[Muricauda] yonaguniensis]MDF0717057.1 heparan-alpha-glucosaminide N-acetyltransferase domain-containing protein [[Muricauda] yonaguniensis]